MNTSETICSKEPLKENPHIAIAGATGRVGRQLQAFGSQEYSITALEHKRPILDKETAEVMPGFDITDAESVKIIADQLAKNGIQSIINCAGDVAVDQSEAERGNPDSNMYRVHVTGVENLAKACKDTGLKLVQLSTEYVFDGRIPQGQKYKASDSPDTSSDNPTWYGLTKALAEQRIREIYPEGSVIIRIGQVQGMGGGHFLATLRQLAKGEPFTRVNNQLMAPIADITVIKAISLIERSLHAGKHDAVYQVNAQDAHTSYETALMLADAFGLGEKARDLIKPVTLEELVASGEQKVVRPKNTVLDISGFERQFGTRIIGKVEDEIKVFRDLYRSQIFPTA